MELRTFAGKICKTICQQKAPSLLDEFLLICRYAQYVESAESADILLLILYVIYPAVMRLVQICGISRNRCEHPAPVI
jgi:hypothetical protein